MRLPLTCPQCMRDNIADAGILAMVEFRDDSRYDVVCPKGHKGVVALQQQKFEILFEIGAYAIFDGYYREAVSSFASSLERLYEFFVRAAALEAGLSEQSIADAWKLVAAQSERQLGAFAFLHLFSIGVAPTLLPNKQVAFRNEVVHKGRIPTKAEAIDFGQAVLDVARPTLASARAKSPKGVEKAVFFHLRSGYPDPSEKLAAATLGISTILSLSKPMDDTTPLADAIAKLRKR